MKKSTSLAMAMGWVFSISVAGSAYAQTVEIGTWAGFRSGAASFTFDDGGTSHITSVGPMFDKYGYKATFNLVSGNGASNWTPDWNGFQKLASNGHEIASHSDTHPQNMSGQEASSKKAINDHIQQEYGCVTLAYPNCNVPNESAVLQNYILGRICNGSWKQIADVMTKDGPSNWAMVPALMTGSEGGIKTTNDFTSQMQGVVRSGGWVAFLTHGLTGKNNGTATYSPTDSAAIDGALQWAKQNDSAIWVAPMGYVGMYIKERKASTATASTSGNTITVKLTHNIADNISKYDYPLSLRIKNSSNWTAASGTQGGKAVKVDIKSGYLYFDAVPNGGDIVISSGGGSTNPTSSSATQPTSSNSSIGVSIEYKLEMEDYMQGGEGVGYSALNDDSEATGYRSDDAGIVKVGTDGYGVGYTMAGEWYAYSLVIRCEGQFSVVARAATGAANKARFTVSADNVAGEVAVDVPSTPDDWNAYAEVDGSGTLNLVPGDNVIRVHFDDSYINVDWIKLTSSNAQCAYAIPVAKNLRLNSLSGPVQYQVFDMNGHLIKSATVSAQGGVQALWQGVSTGLPKGMYVLRYGNGSSTRSVQVRK